MSKILDAFQALKDIRDLESVGYFNEKDSASKLKKYDLALKGYRKIVKDLEEAYFKTENVDEVEKPLLISKKRYTRLLDKEALLETLQEYGVDNWGGYPEAMSAYRKLMSG